jgi:hypothetical protein
VDELTVVHPARTTDRRGNPTRDFASNAGERVDVVGRVVEKSQDESSDSTVLSKAKAYLPAGTEVVTGDRIEHGDVTWEVSGVVNKSLPITNGAYVRVELERVTYGG